MDTFFDYIHWIGRYSYDEVPFNEVDQLIYSVFAYVRFELLGTGEIDFLSAVRELLSLPPDVKKSRVEKDFEVLKAAAASKRFGCSRVFRPVAVTDSIEVEQFAAVTFILKDFIVVSYRGTDNTVLGWKEDFNMAVSEEVPAQRDALGYLKEISSSIPDLPIIITGHSKGANLALYSYIKAPDFVRDRVGSVYVNDGPGFLDEDVAAGIDEKVHSFVPESSIVGMLLFHSENYRTVKSSSFSVLQHDYHTWILDGPSFMYSESLSKSSESFDRKFRAFMKSSDEQERSRFINTLFDLIFALDLENARKNPRALISGIPSVLRKVSGMGDDERKFMLSFVGEIVKVLVPDHSVLENDDSVTEKRE